MELIGHCNRAMLYPDRRKLWQRRLDARFSLVSDKITFFYGQPLSFMNEEYLFKTAVILADEIMGGRCYGS